MKTPDPNQIAQEAIEILNKRITNEIFMIIQNDRDLMQKYLLSVEKNKRDVVNMAIGKKIKEAYSLVNINEREDNPSCTLIQSHQKFK